MKAAIVRLPSMAVIWSRLAPCICHGEEGGFVSSRTEQVHSLEDVCLGAAETVVVFVTEENSHLGSCWESIAGVPPLGHGNFQKVVRKVREILSAIEVVQNLQICGVPDPVRACDARTVRFAAGELSNEDDPVYEILYHSRPVEKAGFSGNHQFRNPRDHWSEDEPASRHGLHEDKGNALAVAGEHYQISPGVKFVDLDVRDVAE